VLGIFFHGPEEKGFAGAAVLPEAADVAFLLLAGLGFEVFALVLDEHYPAVGELGGEVGEESAGGDGKAVGGWAVVEVANPVLDFGAFVDGNGAVQLLALGVQFANLGVEVLDSGDTIRISLDETTELSMVSPEFDPFVLAVPTIASGPRSSLVRATPSVVEGERSSFFITLCGRGFPAPIPFLNRFRHQKLPRGNFEADFRSSAPRNGRFCQAI